MTRFIRQVTCKRHQSTDVYLIRDSELMSDWTETDVYLVRDSEQMSDWTETTDNRMRGAYLLSRNVPDNPELISNSTF